MATEQQSAIEADNVFEKTKRAMILSISSVIEVVRNIEALTKEVIHDTEADIDYDWSNVNGRASAILETIQQDELKISVLGSTSSGKSTVINALLGERILPTGKGTVTQCAITISGLDVDKGYWISEKDPDKKENLNSLCANATKKESGIHIFLPKTKYRFLSNNFVMIDSPGAGSKEDLDENISKYCTDSDVFVLVINGESAMNLSEKSFFLRVSKMLSPPNICILVNRWDLCENDLEVDRIKEQHMESCQELLKITSLNESQSDRVFFVSAEKSLESRMKASVTVSGVHNQDKDDKWETFEKMMTECASKNAVETKFYKHIKSGMDICNVIQTEIAKKIEQLEIIRAVSELDKKFKDEMPSLKKKIEDLIEKRFQLDDIKKLLKENQPHREKSLVGNDKEDIVNENQQGVELSSINSDNSEDLTTENQPNQGTRLVVSDTENKPKDSDTEDPATDNQPNEKTALVVSDTKNKPNGSDTDDQLKTDKDKFDAEAYKQTLTQRFMSNLEKMITQICQDDLKGLLDSTVESVNTYVQTELDILQKGTPLSFGNILTDYTYNTRFKPNLLTVGVITLVGVAAPLVVTFFAKAAAVTISGVLAAKAVLGGGFSVLGAGISVTGIRRLVWDQRKIAYTKFIKHAEWKFPDIKKTVINSIYETCETQLRVHVDKIKNQNFNQNFGDFKSSKKLDILKKQIDILQNERERATKLYSEFVNLEKQVKHLI